MPKDKLGIVDIKPITKSGKTIHIEMQALPQKYISERVTYYNSKMLVIQLGEGAGYGTLQKAISILIADFDIIDSSEKYHHVFQPKDRDTGILFMDAIEIHTLEPKKLPKASADASEAKLLAWLQFLKAEEEEQFEMLAEKDPMIKKAYATVKLLVEDESFLQHT